MKKCFKCGARKSLTEFYKHSGMKDGHLNKCKPCARADSTNNRNRNIEKVRAYDRSRGNRQTPEYLKEVRRKHPNKYKAQTMVGNAIRDKRLFREPCENCGDRKTHGHHDDYLKPLNIRWLCPACHSQWHRDNGEAKNP